MHIHIINTQDDCMCIIMGYLQSIVNICTDLNMTIFMNKFRVMIIITIIIIIVRYATFMQRSRKIHFHSNMQKKM